MTEFVKQKAVPDGRPPWKRFLLRHLNRSVNLAWDVTHGGWYGGIKPHDFRDQGAFATMSTDVLAMGPMFGKLSREMTFVDVGCGRGRVIRWLLAHGHTGKIVGIELDEEVARCAKKHFAPWPNVEIVHAHILEHLRPEWHFFYLFNPFDATIVSMLLKVLSEIHRHDPEPVNVFYYNPRLLVDKDGIAHNFDEWAPGWEIRAARLPTLSNFAYLTVFTHRMRG